ncbi:MAG: metallophosphoesterase family protein [Nitrososphaeraceae archaeon]
MFCSHEGKVFNDKHVSLVIHAGDIVSPAAVEAFTGVKPIAVLGNNDLEIDELTIYRNRKR